MISSAQLAKALIALSKEEKNQDKVLEKFFTFLKHHSLEGMLEGVLHELSRLSEEEKRKETLSIQTAQPLSEKSKAHIKKIIGASEKTNVEKEVREELLGGFRARYQGFEYQGSLKHQVDTLEKQLVLEN